MEASLRCQRLQLLSYGRLPQSNPPTSRLTAPQAKAGIPELRKTKGCVVWLSSGAALKPYTAWAAYGSSKAAVNSISTHLAVEEPDITSITVAPGRVDTDMQAVLRASGKDTMNKAQYDSFVDAFEQGKLLKPEQPGHVVAKFVMGPQKNLSGQCLKYVLMQHPSLDELLTRSQLELSGAGLLSRAVLVTRCSRDSKRSAQVQPYRRQYRNRQKDLQSQSKDEKLLIFSTGGFSISME